MEPAIKLNFKKAFYMAYLQLHFFKGKEIGKLKRRARFGSGRKDCKLGGNIMEPLIPTLGGSQAGEQH